VVIGIPIFTTSVRPATRDRDDIITLVYYYYYRKLTLIIIDMRSRVTIFQQTLCVYTYPHSLIIPYNMYTKTRSGLRRVVETANDNDDDGDDDDDESERVCQLHARRRTGRIPNVYFRGHRKNKMHILILVRTQSAAPPLPI